MKSHVQVITTPTADTRGLSLMLHFDDKRYLVGGMPEGLQRASVQRGVRLMKLNECFITGRSEWQNTGGLIGMILTLADVSSSSRAAIKEELVRKAKAKATRLGFGDDKVRVQELVDEATKESRSSYPLTIFSPPNLNYQLATARRYVFRKGMPVDVHEVEASSSSGPPDQSIQPMWQDDNIKVWPMAILPGTSRPENPRKRSFEMIDDNAHLTLMSDDLPEDEHHKLMVKGIVGEMFNSNWRLDTLHPTRLADVKMPAGIFVRNDDDNKIERYRGPMPGGTSPLPDPDTIVFVRKPWPGARIERLPPATPARESLSYIICGHTRRGKFDARKAMDLKVKPGPDFGRLAEGESVVNVEGATVTSDQVLGPPRPGGGFAVIDLPDESYIDNLIARPEWQDNSVMEGVEVIFWNCGQSVTANASVKRFMADMPKIRHIVSSAEHCPNQITFGSSAKAITELQQLDKKRFRIPIHDNKPKKALDSPAKAILAKPGQIIQLEPAMKVVEGDIVQSLHTPSIIRGMDPDVLTEAEAARTAIAADWAQLNEWASSIPGKDVEITTLGTGSALPSKYRNVSATLLRVPGWGSLLFDCGENTLGQLKRAFPADELKSIIAELRIIVISHMHADHHLGTASVIKAWYEGVHKLVPAPAVNLAERKAASLFGDSRRLAVLAEPAMQHWLSEYAAIEDYGYSRLAPLTLMSSRNQGGEFLSARLRWFVPPHEAREESKREVDIDAQAKVAPSMLGLSDIHAVGVDHCLGAKAVSLTWPDGFKASYSGDCRPSTSFARIGSGSTVCIHEATFDDELQGDADAKRHSTTSEALGVAQAMGAKTCVLTHFSQRYQKIPIIERASLLENEVITQPALIADITKEQADDIDDNDDAANDAPIEAIEDASLLEETVTYTPTHPSRADHASDTSEQRLDHRGDDPVAAVKIQLKSDMRVCVAFDLMRVKVGEIAEMQYFTPALLKLLADKSDEPEWMTDSTAPNSSKRRN